MHFKLSLFDVVKGWEFVMSLEMFYAFLFASSLCAMFYGGAYALYSYVDSIPSESLSNIKKGEIIIACPYFTQG